MKCGERSRKWKRRRSSKGQERGRETGKGKGRERMSHGEINHLGIEKGMTKRAKVDMGDRISTPNRIDRTIGGNKGRSLRMTHIDRMRSRSSSHY